MNLFSIKSNKRQTRQKRVCHHVDGVTYVVTSYPEAVACTTIKLWWFSFLNKDWVNALFLGSTASAVSPYPYLKKKDN